MRYLLFGECLHRASDPAWRSGHFPGSADRSQTPAPIDREHCESCPFPKPKSKTRLCFPRPSTSTVTTLFCITSCTIFRRTWRRSREPKNNRVSRPLSCSASKGQRNAPFLMSLGLNIKYGTESMSSPLRGQTDL